MLREIRVYGYLRKLCGQTTFRAVVKSASEAVSFLLCHFPELQHRFNSGWFTVVCDDQAITEEEIAVANTAHVIKIIPVQTGAFGGDDPFSAVGRIIAGVALVAASIFLGPIGFATAGLAAPLFGATTALAVAGIGASLVLGGVAQLIAPVPTIGTSGSSMPGVPTAGSVGGYNSTRGTELDPDLQSYNFSGLANTSKAGLPVQVVLGELLCGSAVISAGIDTLEPEEA